MTDDREPFREARAAGLQKRHEQRLENATYTAAEVRVLTEAASKVAYALGRKDAGEEIAAALEDQQAKLLPGRSPHRVFGLAIQLAREIASQPSPGRRATSGRTDPEEPK